MWRKKEQWNQMNCHHIIWQSQHKDFFVEDTRNKLIMNMMEHNHLHWFMKWALTPKDQFDKLFNLTKSTMSELAINLLDQLVNLDDTDFYIPELLKWTKKKSHKQKLTDWECT
jgi:hypothetical protein